MATRWHEKSFEFLSARIFRWRQDPAAEQDFTALGMREDMLDQTRVLDPGNDAQCSTTIGAGLEAGSKSDFEALPQR